MTIRLSSIARCAVFALFAVPVVSAAQTAGPVPVIDCANSHAMMAHLMNPNNGPFTGMSPSFGVDRNYGSAQMQIARLQANLAKIELACGTNAKARAAAQKALDDANAMEAEINAMIHTN